MQNDQNEQPTDARVSVLKSVFQRLGKGYIQVTMLPKKLMPDEKALLKIKNKKTFSQKEVLNAFLPLPPPFDVLQKGASKFITDKPVQDLLLEHIALKPGKTLEQMAAGFPMKIADVINKANALIKQGAIVALIRPTKKIELHLQANMQGTVQTPAATCSAEAPVAPDSPTATPADPVQAFKQAYDAVGPDTHFVEIYKIRRKLNWSRQQFDDVLMQLMTDGHIVANLGNPGDLTQDEVLASYRDEYGDLFITVTWRQVNAD